MYAMRLFIVLVTAVLAACGPDAESENDGNKTPPNIIVIFADDAGVEAFEPYGGLSYETPKIAELADRGVKFTRAFSQPLCTPSRVQLLTGKHNYRNYEAFGWLDPDEQTFAQTLQRAGYRTAVAGKWQLSTPDYPPFEYDAARAAPNVTPDVIREDYGFDQYSLWQLNHVGEQNKGPRYWAAKLEVDGRDLTLADDGYGPDHHLNYLVDFMRRRVDQSEPFLAYFPTALPHAPWVPTPHTATGPTNDSMRSTENFGANIEYLDFLVGQLTAAVDELGIADNTYIIFTSDNGTARSITSQTNAGPVKGDKAGLTVPGTHVPLIIAGPSVDPGSRDDRPVGLADVTATIVALAGADAETLDGQSLIPVAGTTEADRLYSWYDPKGRPFTPGAVAMSTTQRVYDDGRVTAIEAQEPCCILREVATEDAPDPELEALLDRHAQGSARPNVLLIFTDDQGYADVGAYGSTFIDTPNIDRLAAEGVRFTQFYAAAAVCTPSRAGLLTGKTPDKAGVTTNIHINAGPDRGLQLEEVTIAEVLSDNGYRTAAIGKWHLSGEMSTTPNYQGFDHAFGHLDGVIDNYSHTNNYRSDPIHDLYRNGKEIFEDGRFFADLMVEETLEFIDRDDARPFFIYFALNSPHYPYQGDPEWLAAYSERGLERRQVEYGAFVSTMDARIGALLDALQQRGVLDDTIVIFQSDHGFSTEERALYGGGSAGIYRGAKFSQFEGGLRVPGIIRWPGKIPAGEVRDQFAVSQDWFPTILEYAGIDYDVSALDGNSLVPLISDASESTAHDTFVWHQFDYRSTKLHRYAVREGDWKLLLNPRDTSPLPDGKALVETLEGTFLYNLADDPGETNNVHEQHPDIVNRLLGIRDEYVAELEAMGRFDSPSE